jgi:hypothetical protein
MTPSIYIDPSGVIRYIENCPEEPKSCSEQSVESYQAWHRAIQAAKDSAVPFEDQNLGRCLVDDLPSAKIYSCCQHTHSFHKGCLILDTSHDLPEGYSVEVRNQGVCCSPMPPNINHHGYCDRCSGYTERKVAILIPPAKEEPLPLEESQKELWDEAEDLAWGELSVIKPVEGKLRVHHVINVLKEKFTITRKP